MIKGKKATREERKVITKHGLDSFEWLVQKNTIDYLQVVNRETKEERVLSKK